MHIKDHGAWERYTPQELPKDAPGNAMFARRLNDKVDWYEYVREDHFDADTIKLTVVGGIVGAATMDPRRLFPGGATVLEISFVVTDDPAAMFENKHYDAAKKTFGDPPPLPPDPMEGLLKRIEALEAKGA